MDLQLAMRVLWRFRVLVAAGLALGLSLAFLSMVHVSLTGSPHFSYRAKPQYQSTTTVGVTTNGFWQGSLNLHAGSKVLNAPRGPVDTGVLRNLASYYLTLATGNDVMKELAQSGKIDGVIQAYPVLAPDSTTQPLFGLTAIAPSQQQAYSLSVRHLRAFRSWLRKSQEQVGTKPDSRVILQTVAGPTPPTLLMGRKKTKPILILLSTLVAVCGLAFALENLRPRIRSVSEKSDDDEKHDRPTQRLTA